MPGPAKRTAATAARLGLFAYYSTFIQTLPYEYMMVHSYDILLPPELAYVSHNRSLIPTLLAPFLPLSFL